VTKTKDVNEYFETRDSVEDTFLWMGRGCLRSVLQASTVTGLHPHDVGCEIGRSREQSCHVIMWYMSPIKRRYAQQTELPYNCSFRKYLRCYILW